MENNLTTGSLAKSVHKANIIIHMSKQWPGRLNDWLFFFFTDTTFEILFLFEAVSLGSSGYTGTQYVEEAVPKLTEIHLHLT